MAKAMNQKLKNKIRRNRSESDILLNKLLLWEKGKNPFMFIENKESSKERIKKVKFNDHLKGSFKDKKKQTSTF